MPAPKYTFTELVDCQKLQSLMERFTKATGILSAILDIDATILVATGWQDICAMFHRVHPVTVRCCQESDSYILSHLKEGHYVEYKCKNGLQDLAVPIIIGDQHVATFFMGQFFYEDEAPDKTYFRKQAEQYGFDVQDYMRALSRVPVYTREQIQHIMDYYTEFVDFISSMGARNLELKREMERRRQTERTLQKSEQSFRELVDSSLIGISIVQDGWVVYQNPEQERLLGPLPRKLWLKDLESIHLDDVEKAKRFYQDLALGQDRRLEMDFRFYGTIQTDDLPQLKWLFCRTNPIEYLGQEAVLVNVMDITRIKEMEYLLRIQDKMTSLGRVASGIAHEIRNPLSGINIYLNTLAKLYERGENPEKIKEILGQVQSASNKIESIIRRVLDFSKPSALQFALKDINQPIEKAINLSSAMLRKTGIEFEKSLAEDLPPCKIDPNLIEEVILNVITNAAEAMKSMEGAKKIAVATSMEDEHVLVRIFDSGPGVPANLRNQIFDPFYTTKSEGTGIGLSLSHRIITDHGGSLEVSSGKLGGGPNSRFQYRLKNRVIDIVKKRVSSFPDSCFVIRKFSFPRNALTLPKLVAPQLSKNIHL